MITTAIPVHITAEAERRLEEPGLRAAFEQILDYVKQHTPGIRAIDVSYEDDTCVPADVHPWNKIILDVHRTAPASVAEDPTHEEWTRWLVENLTAEMGLCFTLLSIYEEEDGR